MQSEWSEVALEEIVEFLNAKRIPLSSKVREKRKGIYPYYGASGIVDYLDDYIFDGKYLLISEDGENLKTRKTPIAFIAEGKYWVNNHAHILDEKDDGIIVYLKYYFSVLNIKPYLTGAVQPKLNKRTLSAIPIKLAPKETRLKINYILSTLDDKIELNRKMNQTLEMMAQALFKSWFVDFDPVHVKAACKSDAELEKAAAELGIAKEILELLPREFEESEMGMIPKGWEFKELGDFGRVITGKTPPKKVEDAYNNDGKPFITPTDIDDSLFVTFTNRHLSENGQIAIKNTAISAGSLCVTCIGSQMGKTVIAPTDSFTNQQINSVVIDSKSLRNYLFYNLRSRKKEIFSMGSGGSTMPLLNKSSFEKIKVLLPSQDVLESFNAQIKDKLALVLANDLQSMTLSKTRDTLLPKLLSGEMDVSNIEFE